MTDSNATQLPRGSSPDQVAFHPPSAPVLLPTHVPPLSRFHEAVTARPNRRVLVVIPTFNESENISTLVRTILDNTDYRVMVVDDNSPDKTGDIAEKIAAESGGRVQVVHRTGQRGFSRSYIDGFAHALRGDAERIVQMDADWSHDPGHLPALVEAAERFDVVIGSRYLHGISVVNWPLSRLVLSSFANAYVRLIVRLPTRDCTSGFRCWRREALARIPFDRIRSEAYSFLVESLNEARLLGCSIGEAPIVFVERRSGRSKLNKRTIVESALIPWMLVCRNLFRRRVAA